MIVIAACAGVAMQERLPEPFPHVSSDHLVASGMLPARRDDHGPFAWQRIRPRVFGYCRRMLIAEDVLLLLVDDRTGRFLVDSTRLDNVLAGAVLVELATIERLGFPPEGSGVRRGRMVVVNPTPPGDPVLDRALATVAASRPAKPEKLIAKLRKRLRATLLERLTAAGALRRSTRRVLGILPRTIWPAGDSSHKRELRARLQDVLVAGATPDGRTAALVSLLAAVNAAHKVVDGNKKAVRARAKDIAAGDWAGAAVKKAIDAVNASIAIVIAVGAAGAAGSSS